MDIETLLHNRIVDLFDELDDPNLDIEQRKAINDELVKLMEKASEMEKLKVQHDEYDLKQKQTKEDHDLKCQQMKEEKKDRIIKNVIGIGQIVVPIVAAGYWTWMSMVFEKEDTLTNTAGKRHLDWLLRLKK